MFTLNLRDCLLTSLQHTGGDSRRSFQRIAHILALVVLPVLAFGCVPVWAQGDPVPEFYGIYALQNGKLAELYQDPNLNDFGPAIRFIFFQKGGNIPVNKMFFIPDR